MNSIEQELRTELETMTKTGLLRKLRPLDSAQSASMEIAGKKVLNFSSNDYLGLANHPRLKEAGIQAMEKYGAGSGASRLICGSLAPHQELERTLAQFKKTDAALAFSSGYAAALGTICALMGKEDCIVLDKLVHASIVDAAKLSQAKLRIFPHNDLKKLEELVLWAKANAPMETARPARILIVTESVFSMDGDDAPLREIVELKEKLGVWLMVDEAHATGLFGAGGAGLADHLGVSDRIEVQMGTLGKALGAAGGYICGSHTLIEYLVNRARSFIFSTAPTPASVAAAQAGILICQSEEGKARRNKLWESIEWAKQQLLQAGWQLPTTNSAIIPLIIGDEAAAVDCSRKLLNNGIFIPAIRYPSVGRGKARLRLTLSANHTNQHLDQLLGAVRMISPARAHE